MSFQSLINAPDVLDPQLYLIVQAEVEFWLKRAQRLKFANIDHSTDSVLLKHYIFRLFDSIVIFAVGFELFMDIFDAKEPVYLVCITLSDPYVGISKLIWFLSFNDISIVSGAFRTVFFFFNHLKMFTTAG